MWQEEIKQLAALCKVPNDAFVNDRHLALETFQPPGSLAFQALLGLLDGIPVTSRQAALRIATSLLKESSEFLCREIVSSHSLRSLTDSAGWPLIRSLTIQLNGDQKPLANQFPLVMTDIRALCLFGGTLDEDIIRLLAAPSCFPELRALEFTACSFSESGQVAFQAAPILRQLEEFHGGTAEDFETKSLLKLRSVSCYGNPAIIRLLNEQVGTTLRELVLLGPIDEGESVGLIEALTTTRPLADNIESLTFVMSIDDSAIKRIAQCSHLNRLSKLALSASEITPAGIQALQTASFVQGLKSLELTSSSIGDEGWTHLANMPFANLEVLKLVRTGGSRQGLKAISKSPHMASLRRLEIGGNNVDGDGIEALVFSDIIGGIEFLDLKDNPIGSQGANALASASQLQTLRHLRVNGIDGSGVTALLKSPFLDRLESLIIGFLSDEVKDPISGIMESSLLTNLVMLVLTGSVTDAGVKALSETPRIHPLRRLLLSGNITSEGVDALARSPHLSNLWQLGFGLCPLGDSGAEALASSVSLPRLNDLRLSCCGLSETGSHAIAYSEVARHLRWLSIDKKLLQPWTTSPLVSSILKSRIIEILSAHL